ncbi:MAG: type VI secretion system-associated FHA domain protein TagH [Xanthomonadaceae bacterium]|nr:type VI secretion system-associated FHA domain protein TagH [Xanthomonadaceae bacterium]
MPQTLTLEVSGCHAAQFGARARKVFEGRGGSIGRSEDCDWVLGASGVSRVHAVVRLLDGHFAIEDRSTNGMLLNGLPLVKGEPARLGDGDCLTVDTFEIKVRLSGLADAPLPASAADAGHAISGADDDPGDTTGSQTASPWRNDGGSSPQTITPAPAPTVSPAFGLPAEVEQIFRLVVDGVMGALRAHTEVRHGFRPPGPRMQRSEDNPLRFAPTPDDALARILAPPAPGVLSGAAAFEDAFDDIRCHQAAMLAGMRAAFEQMLAGFSPERFEQDGEGGGKRAGFIDFSGRSKPWERYREHWEAINRDPDERFRRLFGEAFAKAYEDQLSRQKPAPRMQQAGQR